MDKLRAFLFGITLAAAMGPIALLIMHNALNHGLRAALASALGVALADLTYAALALGAGAALADTLREHRAVFELAASGLLLGLGLWLARGALHAGIGSPSKPRAVGLMPTYLLTLANPLTVLLFVGFSGQLSLARGWRDVALFASLIFVGSLPVQAAYAAFGAALQRFAARPGQVRALNLASGMGIAAFGAHGLIRAL